MENSKFDHSALQLEGDGQLVYTAMSKHLFYYRMHISRYVLEQGKVPLNPFMLFDYFLLDSVDRDTVRKANNSVVHRADAVWVFGPVSDGVLSEILIAREQEKELRFFAVRKSAEIVPVQGDEVEMEDEVAQHRELLTADFLL